MRRFIAAAAAGVLAAALLTACGPGDEDGRTEITRSQLESAGITVVESEADVTETPTTLTVTAIQADRLVAEANLGSGILGSDLDAIAPVEAGLPPASYLIAAWVSESDLAGATIASTMFREDTDRTHAPDIVFPTAAVALFVADLMDAAADPDSFGPAPMAGGLSTGTGTGTGEGTGKTLIHTASFTASGPCSAVTGFLSATIQGLFDVLRVLPNAIGSIKELGFFGKLLGGIVSVAIDLAQGVVTGLIKVITAPVLEVLRLAITSLGVASLVASYFTNQKLTVTANPQSHITFAIDPAPGNPGTFTATTQSLTKDWPSALVDCARATNVTLPDLLKGGDTANWTALAGAGLVTLKSTTSTVSSDRTTTVDFVSGTEDAETAKGPEQTKIARVSVSVPGKEISDFLNLAVSQLESVKASVLSAIPSPLQSAAQAVLAKTLDPIVTRVRAEIQGAVGGLLTLKGEGFVWVTFHRPKDPESDPPSEPADPHDGAFCEQFREKVAIANEGLQATAVDVFEWSAAFAAELRSIPAAPPPSIAGDFAVLVGFYEFAGSLDISTAGALVDYITANDSDAARERVWTTCDAPLFDAGF